MQKQDTQNNLLVIIEDQDSFSSQGLFKKTQLFTTNLNFVEVERPIFYSTQIF